MDEAVGARKYTARLSHPWEGVQGWQPHKASFLLQSCKHSICRPAKKFQKSHDVVLDAQKQRLDAAHVHPAVNWGGRYSSFNEVGQLCHHTSGFLTALWATWGQPVAGGTAVAMGRMRCGGRCRPCPSATDRWAYRQETHRACSRMGWGWVMLKCSWVRSILC